MGAARRQAPRSRTWAAAPAAGDVQPTTRGASSVRRVRLGHRPALRARQADQDEDEVYEFCPYLRGLYPEQVRLAIVCDIFSPHLTTKKCRRVADWAEANNVEIAYTPTNSSWLNRIEAQFTALRYFALDGTTTAPIRNRPA